MKHYIFGGNGFVGRYLATDLLKKGGEVIVCDLQESLHSMIDVKACGYEQVNIRQIEDLERLPIGEEDILINLAANQYHTKVPRDRKQYFFSVNVEGTRNILKVAYEKGCRNYLMFTTDMTYGKPEYLPVDLNHPQNPFGPYGQSKKMAEDICRVYRSKGMNITIMRPRMINGPGRLGILVKLFKLIDMNLPVPTIGNGKNHYQMISVFDCVSAIECALAKGMPNREYNLGSTGSPDITSLLKGVIKEAGSRSFVIHTPGKLVKQILGMFDAIGLTIMYKEQYMIADEEYILDISETEKDLDWHPQYNDADMITEAYRTYKEMKK